MANMNPEKAHISVCICTYKRPQLLRRLLIELERQVTDQLFSYSVTIVDNDAEQSARGTVESFRAASRMVIDYHHEPVQNIALARNKAVQNSAGDFVAFLDDDEFPVPTWLLSLYMTCRTHNADGVLGPVKPHFETDPPAWIVKGKICERKTHATGTVLRRYGDTRTGNVLLARKIFNGESQPFNPRFGRSGGEDVDFFRRMMEKGYTFIWCNDAVAYETVPAERLTRGYYLRRALLRGKVAFHHPPLKIKIAGIAKSVVAVPLYSLLLPLFLIAGSHVFMKYLIKYCDHVGKLLAAVGLNFVKERSS